MCGLIIGLYWSEVFRIYQHFLDQKPSMHASNTKKLLNKPE